MRTIFLQRSATNNQRPSLGQAFDPSVGPFSCTIAIGGLCDDRLRILATQALNAKFEELIDEAVFGFLLNAEVCRYAESIINNTIEAVRRAYADCALCWGEFDYDPIYSAIAENLTRLNQSTGADCRWYSQVPTPSTPSTPPGPPDTWTTPVDQWQAPRPKSDTERYIGYGIIGGFALLTLVILFRR